MSQIMYVGLSQPEICRYGLTQKFSVLFLLDVVYTLRQPGGISGPMSLFGRDS